MITGMIIDDDWSSIEYNQRVIESSGQIEIIASTHHIQQAMRYIQDYKPDVAFVTIDIPRIDGIKLARQITTISIDTHIVFVSEQEIHAKEAFEIGAIDYIIKPLNQDRVLRVVKRLLKWKHNSVSPAHVESKAGIYILGTLKINIFDQNIDQIKWRTSKTAELLAFLLIHQDEEVSKDKIMDALWPECDIDHATTYMHTTIYKLKTAFKNARISYELRYQDSSYQLKLFHVYMDYKDFALLWQAKEQLTAERVSWMEEKLSLYKGNLFGDRDFPWATMVRETYLLHFIHYSNLIAQYYLEEAQFLSAKTHLLKVLQFSPYEEETHLLLLQVYFQSGDRISFLKHYQYITHLFETELGIKPSPAIRNLVQQFHDHHKI